MWGDVRGVKACRVLLTTTTCDGTDITSSANWTSSNPTVAHLSAPGTIHADSAGSSTITATSGTLSDNLSFQVNALPLVDCWTCNNTSTGWNCESQQRVSSCPQGEYGSENDCQANCKGNPNWKEIVP